jgi:Zn finger protein HypA/HybF involved in hydrogenase expression
MRDAEKAAARREEAAARRVKSASFDARELLAAAKEVRKEIALEQAYTEVEYLHYSLCCPRCEEVVLSSANLANSLKCENCLKAVKLIIRQYNNGSESFLPLCPVLCHVMAEVEHLHCPKCRAMIRSKFLTVYSDKPFNEIRSGCGFKFGGCFAAILAWLMVPIIMGIAKAVFRIQDTNNDPFIILAFVFALAALIWFGFGPFPKVSEQIILDRAEGRKLFKKGFEIPDDWLSKSKVPPH